MYNLKIQLIEFNVCEEVEVGFGVEQLDLNQNYIFYQLYEFGLVFYYFDL